ncbi:site-specific recombinase XerD [Defluviimonas denitrificans]|jgi:integrase|uniref:Site-specific recombinase XerD n=1 Tax=Albidovulum denitrificans TaxID=404881 RepID=A0A2S8SDG0_9RHOB|nr:tyrosine-type recombinase/integrase [Defluviimonas denitrificans]PQV58772.1 site-specific recombinase XerD [Defluviimonas denitrificans]
MPRPSKGARVYERKRKDREPVWVIRDGAFEKQTGARNRVEAETALAQYINGRGLPGSASAPEDMRVGLALSIYGEEHAIHCADPARIGFAIDALDPFWGDLRVSDVKGATCRRYMKWRARSDGTMRRELGVLQASLNYCEREGHLTSAPTVTLPEKPAAKERWLTRTEVYWMLRASRRLRIDGKHLRKFIIAGRYTGTRKTALLNLSIDMPSVSHGWVDTESGIMYRIGSAARRSKKKQPTARLPRPFLSYIRRWKAAGCRWVIETNEGNRVANVRNGWANCVKIAEEMAAAAAEKARDPALAIDLTGVTPHVMRHTAITWAMQSGADHWDVSGFFGVSLKTLEEVYGHHHPDHQGSAVRAMERRSR